jgi:hypothetical protein
MLIGGKMVSQLIEKVKDALTTGRTYRARTIKFRTEEAMYEAAKSGDIVQAKDVASVVKLIPGKEYRVFSKVNGMLSLDGFGDVQAEWLIPTITRYEHVRTRVDKKAMARVINAFAEKSRLDIEVLIDHRIADGKAQIERLNAQVASATESLRVLEETKEDPGTYTRRVARRMMMLVDSGLYTGFQIEGDVLLAYASDFVVKICPVGSVRRIDISSLKPGVPVPNDEGRTGLSNVCFGNASDDVRQVVDDGDWVKILTMVHDFLQGGGKIES